MNVHNEHERDESGQRQITIPSAPDSLMRPADGTPKTGHDATGTASKISGTQSWKFQQDESARFASTPTMAQQRTALWEADLDEDFHDVDLNLAIGSYGQNGLYDDGMYAARLMRYMESSLGYLVAQPRIDEATLIAVQQQVAQQAALAQVPDAVKRVSRLEVSPKISLT